VPVLVENCGNTVASTIPIVLSALKDQGKIEKGQKLVLAGFGVGYSWATCLIHF
jgi:3-oxoacyl-[acyl-carrier-protein] synthase-3